MANKSNKYMTINNNNNNMVYFQVIRYKLIRTKTDTCFMVQNKPVPIIHFKGMFFLILGNKKAFRSLDEENPNDVTVCFAEL